MVLQKYFNGAADPIETQKYQNNLKENFSEIGMFAFGQMPFVAKNGPDPERDYDWNNIDKLVEFAQSNNISIHYNTVINHKESVPEWFKLLSPEEKKEGFKRHIKAVVRRYKGKIQVYKLVNEALRFEDENFLGTNENKVELIAQMFKWAKEEYPEGIFMINDHIPFLKEDNLRVRYIDLISKVIQAGGSIDLVGIEGHLGYRPMPFELPSDEDINNTLEDIYNSTKLPIWVTEFDISYDNTRSGGQRIDPLKPFSSKSVNYENWSEYQAYAYKHFYELCLKKEYVKELIYWGFYDKDYQDLDRPGIGFFDERFSPKPVLVTMNAKLLDVRRA